jgi:predicted nuclease of predicted toxin-antitoxin system
MKVLIDECAPRALKKYLIDRGPESRTVQEAGWFAKQNGELLTLAEAAFDVLVTIDANLRYQQNLAGRKIAVIVLLSFSNRLDHLRAYFPAVALAAEKIEPGEITLVGNVP